MRHLFLTTLTKFQYFLDKNNKNKSICMYTWTTLDILEPVHCIDTMSRFIECLLIYTSLGLNEAYARQWTGSLFVQITAFPLFEIKPFSTNCRLLLTGLSGTNFNDNAYLYKMMNLNIFSAKPQTPLLRGTSESDQCLIDVDPKVFTIFIGGPFVSSW